MEVSPASIPDSFYLGVGVAIVTHIAAIITVIGAAFKLYGRFIKTELITKALHRRVDRLEGIKYIEEKEEGEE